MCVGQAQDVTGLGSCKLLEVTEDEHFALGNRKSTDGIENDLPRLSGEEFVFGCSPRDGFYGPVMGPTTVIGRQKARRIDDGPRLR